MNEVKVNVHCECNHRRGVLYYALPWRWNRPCRRCRRYPAPQVIVVTPPAPTQEQQPQVGVAAQQAYSVPQDVNVQQGYVVQQSTPAQQGYPAGGSDLPPKYESVPQAQVAH